MKHAVTPGDCLLDNLAGTVIGLGGHSTSKVPNWLRNAQLCGRPLVKRVASTDTGLACAATQCSGGVAWYEHEAIRVLAEGLHEPT